MRGRLCPWLGLALAATLVSCSLGTAQPTPERTWRFLAVGDTGTGTAAQATVASAMKRRLGEVAVDFVVLLGDNFYPTGVTSLTDAQWTTKYESLYGQWGLPVYAVLGNHDYGGNGAGTEEAKGTLEVQYSSQSSTWTMPDYFYRSDWGPARLVVLDTNRLKMHAEDVLGQGAAASDWLDTAPGWRIVLGHHPYHSNGPHGNAGMWDGKPAQPASTANGAYFQSFFEAIVAPAADLYLSGHDHSLQVLEATQPPGRLLLVVAGGGGGALTALSGSNPALFQTSSYGFAEVAYDSSRLTITLFNAEGTALYQTQRTR